MNQRLRADLALVFCSFLWGTTFVLVQEALADCSVFVYLAVRFTLAALVLAVFQRADLRRMTRGEFFAGLQIGCFMFLAYAFQTAGLQRTTPSKAAFITGVSVVLVPVLLALLFRRPANAWIWVGALICFCGLYFLTVAPSELRGLNLGDVLVLVCAVMFAFHIIFIGRYTTRYSVGALTFLQIATTAVGSVLALPLLAITQIERPRFAPTAIVISAILITAIFTTALAFSIMVWAQRHTSSAHTALILALEPVFAALTSYVWIHERFGPRAVAGAALIFAGILMVELKGRSPIAVES